MENGKDEIYISEIFGPTIQGEGLLLGQPTIFVRVGGCDTMCKWCDTKYAVLPEYKKDWKIMSCDEIYKKIKELSHNKSILVTLSGGNPALFNFNHLINLGHNDGYIFSIETQGTVCPSWIKKLDYITLSPKGPSSGVKFDMKRLEDFILKVNNFSKITLKIVVKNIEDYNFAKKIFLEYSECSRYIIPCNETPGNPNFEKIYEKMRECVDLVVNDQLYNVKVGPQLHVLLWKNKKGI